ncbi:hypothetical protein PTSG_06165 [Salpingoeca rosetta]|uniref:Complex I assembly factor TIMMDC1, mitochondrial n=1 Tax=Salpingoeca rosetta (strain ATCC 50818 / BSB-021) TaxID=946362 RepID=F2UC49_SALR5|nr:uncharacterized protein PTSG_06165 [Salpingoeca rosetta]EGD74156.1 hypothetical protein PTSG_06165 [Salpingoeca rosetta]|eukprot:XP_004993057.1 hypothetical protein PTSG_06165 [Salpingoeca rosetta]
MEDKTQEAQPQPEAAARGAGDNVGSSWGAWAWQALFGGRDAGTGTAQSQRTQEQPTQLQQQEQQQPEELRASPSSVVAGGNGSDSSSDDGQASAPSLPVTADIKPKTKTFAERIRGAFVPLSQRQQDELQEEEEEKKPDPFVVYMNEKTGMTEEQLASAVRVTSTAGIAGFLFGGVTSISDAAKKYQLENQNTKYHSHRQMQSELNTHVLRTFFRRGSAFGWKTTIFVGGLEIGTKLMEAQRQRKDVFNTVIPGTLMGTVFGLRRGVRGGALGLWAGLVFR